MSPSETFCSACCKPPPSHPSTTFQQPMPQGFPTAHAMKTRRSRAKQQASDGKSHVHDDPAPLVIVGRCRQSCSYEYDGASCHIVTCARDTHRDIHTCTHTYTHTHTPQHMYRRTPAYKSGRKPQKVEGHGPQTLNRTGDHAGPSSR